LQASSPCLDLAEGCEFQWETEEKKAMAMLKEALCKDPALMILDICNGAGLIDMGVNASSVGWWLSYSWKTKIRTTTYITLNVDVGNKATK